MNTNSRVARRTLVALLVKADVHPPDDKERLLIVTCSARMIEETICAHAQYDADDAKEGLARLVQSMNDHIDEICEIAPTSTGVQ